MEFSTQTAKFTAEPDMYHWGSVFAENGLFIVLEVKGNEKKHAALFGKEILELILIGYSDAGDKNLHTVETLLDLVKNKDALTGIVIGVLQGDDFHVGSLGNGEILLKRGDACGKILSGEGLASGKVKSGDLILFSSATFFSQVDAKTRIEILSCRTAEEATEVAVSALSTHDGVYGAGGLLVKLADKEEKDTAKPLVSAGKFFSKEKLSHMSVAGRDKLGEIFENRFGNRVITRQKKILILIIVLLTVFLSVSIAFNISHRQSKAGRQKYEEAVSMVTHQYEEAVNLIDLDPVRARSLLANSKITLSPFLKEFKKGTPENKRLEGLLADITKQETATYKIFKLTAVPVFFDLSLVKQGGTGSKMAGFEEVKIILDPENKTLYLLTTDKKKATIIAGADTLKDSGVFTIHGNNVYALNSEGIFSIDIDTKSARKVIEADSGWGEIKAMAAYGGNLYLLDKGKHTIRKYIATESGFSDGVRYLNPDVRADFSAAENMVIDGSVWVSAGDGLLKYTRGLEETFAFKEFSESLQSVSVFSTTDTDKYIYILDKPLSRIVVFDKDGAYYSQYQWDDLKNANDIFASEAEKKIYVLIGAKIHAIDMK